MKVLLDATAIPANLGGVGRYVDDLVPELINCGVKVALAVQQRDVEHFAEKVPQAKLFPVPSFFENRAARMTWEQTGLPTLAHRLQPDVLHSPHYTFPEFTELPVAVTLHDATFFSHPNAHSTVKRVFFTNAIKRAIRKADALIVPSLATRDESIKYAGGAPERFEVAYHGVDTTTFHRVTDSERDRVAKSLGLEGKPWIGFLGTLEPRKNVPALIRGWIAAVQDRENPPALVLAGGKGWDEEIEPALAEVPDHLTVLRPGYLPLADLPGFLSGSTVLAYPSIGEGFGLPVLEAMACGAAVLTTKALSLPEVGGETVAYCGTTASEIGAGLSQLLDNPRQCQALGESAITRAKRFTWRASAESHIKGYELAIRNSRA